jgi:hypothetical protein
MSGPGPARATTPPSNPGRCVCNRISRGAGTSYLILLAVLTILVVAVPAVANAQQLPKVWIGGPNPSPCSRTVEEHGKLVSREVACYEVRPQTIAISEDGNDFLSALNWTTWTDTKAIATGLRLQRCWGYYPPGHRDPHCPTGAKAKFGYNVPVKVFLAKPLATSHGLLFTVLTQLGQKGQVCVAPIGVGCNISPPTPPTTSAAAGHRWRPMDVRWLLE